MTTPDDIIRAMFDGPGPVAAPAPRAKRRRGPLEMKARRVLSGFGGALLALSAVSVAGGVAVAASGGCDGYTIQSGDTLWGIAMGTGTEVSWLVSMNDIPNPDLIRVGDCLRLPTVGATYEVAPGSPYVANNFVADGPSPGAVALSDALQTVYPQFGRAIDPTYGIGIWNNRAVRNGHVKSTHASGLAFDFYVVCGPEADEMFDRLVANVGQLGIERIVMCDRTWRVDRGDYEPSGSLADLHNGTDAPAHAHVEMTKAAGAAMTYAEAVAVLATVPPGPVVELVPPLYLGNVIDADALAAAEAAGLSDTEPSAVELEFVERINQLRADAGLAKVEIDAEQMAVARRWAAQLMVDADLSHSPDLTAGVSKGWARLGENVGVAPAGEVGALFDAFVASPDHYANLVKPDYRFVGVGVVYDNHGRMWTAHRFMTPDYGLLTKLEGNGVVDGQAVTAPGPVL